MTQEIKRNTEGKTRIMTSYNGITASKGSVVFNVCLVINNLLEFQSGS